MSDILKQIQVLQEQFSELFNEDYDTLDNASHIKRVHGTPEYTKDESGKYKRDENGFRIPANKAAELFQKGHPKDGRTMYGDGYLGQGSGVVWTKRDNNLYDEDDNLKDSNKAVEKSIKRNENKVKKMNDNNSYNEIISQIMDLKEAFSNLFEVEGLGNPAVDVPPSQNKIKRDRKTKDGKVELVSVEDELFPYEGNKKEQYRQKILDTINNMIQGTATLEDLLQIVRQKKAPLKEAMEVLENLGSYIQNKYGDSKKGKELYDKYFQNFNKEANAAITKERVEDIEKKDKKPLEHYVKKLLDKRNETKNSKGEFKTDSRRDIIDQEYANLDRENDTEGKKATQKSIDRHFDKILYKPLKSQANITRKAIATEKFKRMSSEALEEAMELMETALDAIKKSNYSDEKKSELRDKLAKARQEERREADYKAYCEWVKGNRIYNDVEVARSPEYTKNADGERMTRLRSPKNNYNHKIKPEWKQVKDSIKRHEKKVQKKAPLKEAMEILENLLNGIFEEDETPDNLNPKAKKIYAEISNPHRGCNKKDIKRGATQGNFFSQEEIANIANNSVEAQKKHDQETQDMLNNIENSKSPKASENKNEEPQQMGLPFEQKKANEALEEALSLMEEIINEVSLKKWKEAAYNSIDKRREDASKAADIAAQSWDDYEESSRKHPEEEDALYKRAWHADRMDKKASDRVDHALDVLGIKAKGKSANKTIKAAKNSEIKRNDAYLQNTDSEKFDKLRNRMAKTDQLVMADPVKSRNEAD